MRTSYLPKPAGSRAHVSVRPTTHHNNVAMYSTGLQLATYQHITALKELPVTHTASHQGVHKDHVLHLHKTINHCRHASQSYTAARASVPCGGCGTMWLDSMQIPKYVAFNRQLVKMVKTSDIPEVQCSECLVVSWGAVCWCSKPRCCQYSCLYSSDYLQQTCGACLHHSHCNEYSQVNATRRPPTVSSGFKMLDCNLPCLRRYHND